MEKIKKVLSSFLNKLEPIEGLFHWAVIFICLTVVIYLYRNNSLLEQNLSESMIEGTNISDNLASMSAQLIALRNEDQYLINQDLEATISAIEKTYLKASLTYEDLVKLKEKTKTKELDALFADVLVYLSDRDYSKASDELRTMSQKIDEENARIAREFTIPENLVSSNTPPGAGYQVQRVSIDIGEYMVSIISADLNSTRVIVDTASDGTCHDNCPVASVASYAGRSGAFAAINGSYFCPASYPSCAGKTNSFDTLLMNKNKVYFNSDNNVYSNVPAVIFQGSSARFVGASSAWGRDTGVDAVLANQPLLVSGGNSVFGGDGDPKKGSKGGRSFVGASGNTVYIGVVHNATVAESSRVLAAMGIQDALNLDSGGSTALWYGGYKVGPGRDLPNALLFVRK